MRRACAILLLATFSFLLGGAALLAGEDSNLPACCRRLGQHRCSMPSGAQSNGPAVRPAPCASFPGAAATPVSFKAGFVKASGNVHSPMAVHASLGMFSQAWYRAAARSRYPQRGPPAPAA